MASMNSIPQELLFDILAQDVLTNKDVASICLVSRRFNTVGQQSFRRNYYFKVDAPSHPTWKLIRCLLYNPNLGNRFTSIYVRWGARIDFTRYYDPLPRPPTWTWTGWEESRIQELGQEYGLSAELIDEIIAGVDSETLLPFLLYFTPMLRSFDFGSVVRDRRGLDKLLAWNAKQRRASPDDGTLYPELFWLQLFISRLVVSAPSVDRIQWPPGLLSLKTFEASSLELYTSEKPDYDPIFFSDVWSFLYLPNIEVMKCDDVGKGGSLASLQPMVNRLKAHTGYSTLRRLEFCNAEIYTGEMVELAQSTKFLEWISLKGLLEPSDDVLDLPSLRQNRQWAKNRSELIRMRGLRMEVVNLELVLYEFLECNKGSLSPEGLSTWIRYRADSNAALREDGAMCWNAKKGCIEIREAVWVWPQMHRREIQNLYIDY